jgi:predicted Zn-dependent peptidase
MRSLLEKTFESWPGGGSAQPTQARAKAANGKTKGKPLVADAVAAPQADSKLLLVNKPDATQTYFMLGNLGIDRRNPDRPYIEVVNTLFGGRFTSFINTALRIKSGLTYGASSRFEQRLNPGPFLISTFTKNATTEKAMDMTLDVLHQFHENGITQEQLDSAKAYIRGQFPPTLETTNQLARYLAQLEFYGLPATDLEDFFNKLNAMDLATAKRVIEKYYPEKQLVWVVIGKSDEIGPVVKKYAPKMETRSITDAGF